MNNTKPYKMYITFKDGKKDILTTFLNASDIFMIMDVQLKGLTLRVPLQNKISNPTGMHFIIINGDEVRSIELKEDLRET